MRTSTRETVVVLDLFVVDGLDRDESVVGEDERVDGSEEAFFWGAWVVMLAMIGFEWMLSDVNMRLWTDKIVSD